MTNQYDRVSYPDRVQFAELEDDQEVGHQAGNGIYNDYTVQITPKEYRDSFKIACLRLEKTKRTAFIIFGIAIVLILVLLIIVVVAVVHAKKNQKAQSVTRDEYGLLAYPVDKDEKPVIAFDPAAYSSFSKYVENIEFHLKDYDVLMQDANPDKYVICSENMTSGSLEEGQVCMQTPITFGRYCRHVNLYGYPEERPCVLLVLKLNKDMKPSAHISDDDSNAELKKTLDKLAADGLIPLTCEGKTETDRNNMKTLPTGTNNSTTEIEYHPHMGFPLYFFPVRNDSSYINPAVMVQFRSVKMNVDVTIRCTAWVLDNIISTEFTLRMG